MVRSFHNPLMSGQIDKGIGTITVGDEVIPVTMQRQSYLSSLDNVDDFYEQPWLDESFASYMLPGTEALHEIYDLYIYRQADTEGVLNIFRIAKQFGWGLCGRLIRQEN